MLMNDGNRDEVLACYRGARTIPPTRTDAPDGFRARSPDGAIVDWALQISREAAIHLTEDYPIH